MYSGFGAWKLSQDEELRGYALRQWYIRVFSIEGRHDLLQTVLVAKPSQATRAWKTTPFQTMLFFVTFVQCCDGYSGKAMSMKECLDSSQWVRVAGSPTVILISGVEASGVCPYEEDIDNTSWYHFFLYALFTHFSFTGLNKVDEMQHRLRRSIPKWRVRLLSDSSSGQYYEDIYC